jgi:hypothetical protein
MWDEIQRQPRLTITAELGASFLRVWLVFLWHLSTASFRTSKYRRCVLYYIINFHN